MCLNYFCSNATGKCITSTKVTCPTPDLCSQGTCEPSTGTCKYTNVTCANNTQCYKYSCDGSSGGCVKTSIVPTPPNGCYLSFCDTSSGSDVLRVNVPRNCSGKSYHKILHSFKELTNVEIICVTMQLALATMYLLSRALLRTIVTHPLVIQIRDFVSSPPKLANQARCATITRATIPLEFASKYLSEFHRAEKITRATVHIA